MGEGEKRGRKREGRGETGEGEKEGCGKKEVEGGREEEEEM